MRTRSGGKADAIETLDPYGCAVQRFRFDFLNNLILEFETRIVVLWIGKRVVFKVNVIAPITRSLICLAVIGH